MVRNKQRKSTIDMFTEEKSYDYNEYHNWVQKDWHISLR